jgi:hypothetical protein
MAKESTENIQTYEDWIMFLNDQWVIEEIKAGNQKLPRL